MSNSLILYLIELSSNVKTLFIFLGIFGFTISFIMVLYFYVEKGGCLMIFDKTEKEYAFTRKVFKTNIVLMIISIAFAVFCPLKTTIYQMILVDNITIDNAKIIVDSAKEITDYAVEKFSE